MLDLSIVIVNYRSWSKLEGCLLSIDTHITNYKKSNPRRLPFQRWKTWKFNWKIFGVH